MRLGVFSIIDRRRIIKEYTYIIPGNWSVGSICLLPFGNDIVKGILMYKVGSQNIDFQLKKAIKRVGYLSRKYYYFLLKNLILLNIKPGYCLNSFQNLIQDNNRILGRDCNNAIILGKIPCGYESFLREEHVSYYKLLISRNLKRPLLLIAPTGWGKTRLIFVIALVKLRMGISSLILNPEIFLTNQVWNEFRRIHSDYQDYSYIWHSKVTLKERRKIWANLHRPIIIFGTRSAIFLPIANRFCLMMDEGHDPTYLQKEWPYYGTLNLILNEIRRYERVLIFTATVNNQLAYLTRRGNIIMKVVMAPYDLKIRMHDLTDNMIDRSMVMDLRLNYLKGGTSIIYMNHRGYSNRILNLKNYQYLRCYCGRYLYYHDAQKKWKCHRCKIKLGPGKYNLNYNEYLYPGVGIEKLYWDLSRYFQLKDIVWFSSDLSKKRMDQVWNEVRNRPLVMVVTQGFIKGYHLDKIKLLYYMDTHYSINLPQEDKLIKLIQFAGRIKDKKVNIVTYNTNQGYLRLLSSTGSWHRVLGLIANGLIGGSLRISFRTRNANQNIRRKWLTLRRSGWKWNLTRHGGDCEVHLGQLRLLNGIDFHITID